MSHWKLDGPPFSVLLLLFFVIIQFLYKACHYKSTIKLSVRIQKDSLPKFLDHVHHKTCSLYKHVFAKCHWKAYKAWIKFSFNFFSILTTGTWTISWGLGCSCTWDNYRRCPASLLCICTMSFGERGHDLFILPTPPRGSSLLLSVFFFILFFSHITVELYWSLVLFMYVNVTDFLALLYIISCIKVHQLNQSFSLWRKYVFFHGL